MSTPNTAEYSNSVVVRSSELLLAFSCEDGGLRELRRNNGANLIGHGVPCPSIDALVDGKGWLASHTMVRYLGHTLETHDEADELVIEIGLGPLILYDRYTITGTLVTRRVTVKNVGEDAVRLLGLRLALPWACIEPAASCHFEAPGASVRPHVPLSVAAAQRRDVLPRRFFAPGLRNGRAIETAPSYTPGLLALHNADAGETLLCWYSSIMDSAFPQIEGNDRAIQLEHEIVIADLLGENVALTVGTQSILLLHEPWPAALGPYKHTWLAQAPGDVLASPAWLQDAAIYETHPSLHGGWSGLRNLIPQLHALGINTLCLLPIWSFGNGPSETWDGSWKLSGDVFALRDFEQIDLTLGDPADFRFVGQEAHEFDMRVLLDLPLLGCALVSRYTYERPEWFCRDAQGHLVLMPEHASIIAFDWAQTDLREYIATRALDLATTYDLDGFRVITPRSPLPNWAPTIHHYASAGHLAYTRLIDELREQIQVGKPDGVVIGDCAGPLSANHLHGMIDELAHHMFVHTALGRLTPSELREWLSDHALSQLHHHPHISFTESHRTRLINPLADGLRGSRISRMILSGLVFAGFVPSIWSGQEQDEQATIMLLLHAWSEQPVLRRGERLWEAAPCSSPQVWTVVRRCGNAHAIGIMNVSALKQTVTISLPIDMLDLGDGTYYVRDLLTQQVWREGAKTTWKRDELLTLRLTLEPFEAYCIAAEHVPNS